MAGNIPQLCPVMLDLAANDPAVGFQLGFPGTPEPDTAPDSGEVGPPPGQPREQVFELGQLDLQLGLGGARPG